jgi:hypothetical protein
MVQKITKDYPCSFIVLIKSLNLNETQSLLNITFLNRIQILKLLHMKKNFFLFIIMFPLGSFVFAQKIEGNNLPAIVSDSFKTKFATAEKIEWEMDYENYEATFKINKIDITAKFDKDGKWMETETPVNHSNLPAGVKVCLSHQFDIYKENEIEKVEKPDGVNYEFKITCNGLEYEVVIAEKGELISKDQVREYRKED